MNDVVTKSLAMLGMKAVDNITGFEGTISSVCFDLYGCVSVVLTPGVDKDGKPREGHWFDVKRIKKSEERVMPAPSFVEIPMGRERGAAEKPAMSNLPTR